MNIFKKTVEADKTTNHDENNVETSATSCININDININDLEANVNVNINNVRNKKNGKTIEYHLFDYDSYKNNDSTTINSFVDLSSIRSNYLSENKKKKAKKKKKNSLKKQLNIFKQKYKIIPETNLDQDTSYEESVKASTKDYSTYELKEIKEDKSTTDYIDVNKNVFLSVIKIILLVSSIFSFGSISTTVAKYIIFVKKFNYTQIITFLEFLIMFIILKIVVFVRKLKNTTNLTREEYLKYIISIAAMLGFSVITGNSAYSYLEIPIISVVKSSSLILIYFLSVKFGLKEFKCSLVFSILTIMAGVIMSVTTLKIDSMFGLFMLVISVITSSLKWVFTNVLLKTTSMKPHLILFHIYQAATLVIIIPTLLIDFTSIVQDYRNGILTFDQITTCLLLISAGALASIFLILAEFALISRTSSVTLSIVCIGREAIILVIGSIIFGENVDFNSSIGIAISMIGTIFYGYASN
ncbi:triose or hexose phosphate/phosphate translocator, putative [Hepatocystis sp. ex Piliocolobus tephrosceles]|nr:triose or hexose phosphate/phosphate translocator, putative [Hepatocystis sp. ex Piliocolobus tephrosceles]